ncbi:MAG: hypothetical protein F4Z73_01240 [Synechococcus sp. SB0668_bin_13]|nr:hypothetical protein [Synechococcus sp. SB0668_bin_13]
MIPSGLQGGDQFRLLFVSSTSGEATSADINLYNNLIQLSSGAGHQDLRPYYNQFRALISTARNGDTAPVNARDNTSTTGTGVPIYWVNAAKVADDYTDFYDGTWDSNAATLASGSRTTTVTRVWTGSASNGTSTAPTAPLKKA